MVAGVPVALPGEDDVGDVDGDDVALPGEFELLAGSAAQPATNTIERIVGSRSVDRMIKFIFGLLISFASFEQH
ncbi:MAG: hypothetical protein M3R52_02010 [Acidobacteriota bacterium]|nr:hypothetical protein [Acidobacteriota bacterium]